MVLRLGSKGEELNLLIVQGASFGPYLATMTNPNGTPVNLTACTIRGAIAKTPNSPVLVRLEVAITDALKGEYRFSLATDVTASFAAGRTENDEQSRYVWSLELIDSGANVIPLYFGEVQVFRGLAHE
ncbi:MAG: phage baseplate upper protein [Undibacterium sp.]|nr:phage baseplate upper protein [Undibacterium sp.]